MITKHVGWEWVTPYDSRVLRLLTGWRVFKLAHQQTLGLGRDVPAQCLLASVGEGGQLLQIRVRCGYPLAAVALWVTNVDEVKHPSSVFRTGTG